MMSTVGSIKVVANYLKSKVNIDTPDGPSKLFQKHAWISDYIIH